MKKEGWAFFWASLALIGGNAGQFLIPLYIGWFVDDIKNNDIESIKKLVWELVLIIFVIYITIFINIVLLNLCFYKRDVLQFNK